MPTIRMASRWRRSRCRSARAPPAARRARRSWRRAASIFTSRATRFRGRSTARPTASSASEAIRDMLVADGVPAERTVTVHEGIDVEHVEAADPVNVHEAFWLPHHAPVVGNVAALVPHKGQRYLVEAAHLVVQRLPDT